MAEAPCKEPLRCCVGALCAPCCACYQRKEALDGQMDRYECCQGYIPGCCCCKPGKMGEKSCPTLCLCLEGCCCPATSLSVTRMYLQDLLDISSDPMDIRIIKFTNCMIYLSCICNILAIFIAELRELAQIIDCITDCIVASVSGCMSAQIYREIEHAKLNGALGVPSVKTQSAKQARAEKMQR
eukprot:CAMPEP_0118854230 /NCGR_PEP_ID=MMETSP1163-20130328/2525_1 /TAXON_ID=124430 /ORGANISM="Phaeomonas parva, Strain CCMP2877" /LENGTH=183 /DNA_ID=CAMNT_0006786923 /DNA_START=92 /DNA_END=643 /DNA_ORIENTATION=-